MHHITPTLKSHSAARHTAKWRCACPPPHVGFDAAVASAISPPGSHGCNASRDGLFATCRVSASQTPRRTSLQSSIPSYLPNGLSGSPSKQIADSQACKWCDRPNLAGAPLIYTSMAE
ncbi:uncharacterized protein PSANT_06167 [Moesziomyces antarcticus]|uniref:Uncharacterized protein n=1 Tax=Pseudozyma antarctica TaxID=84753 RepID=A0A5C3FW60_PSEA2|nr:uncharacterized protein PSANT_06167 [Moesziomyces antarcticus]